MNHRLIEKTKKFVKSKSEHDRTGHDWQHVERVWKIAKKIAAEEKADTFLVEMAALLHDVDDWKFKKTEKSLAAEWLKLNQVAKEEFEKILEIIDGVTFKGICVKNKLKNLEAKIVQDADRIDALGAIGVARAFAYGGAKGRVIHNPKIRPVLHKTFSQYKKAQGTTINHFYEKLLQLKNIINTQPGKKMALERHKFIEDFLKQFHKEWKGE